MSNFRFYVSGSYDFSFDNKTLSKELASFEEGVEYYLMENSKEVSMTVSYQQGEALSSGYGCTYDYKSSTITGTLYYGVKAKRTGLAFEITTEIRHPIAEGELTSNNANCKGSISTSYTHQITTNSLTIRN